MAKRVKECASQEFAYDDHRKPAASPTGVKVSLYELGLSTLFLCRAHLQNVSHFTLVGHLEEAGNIVFEWRQNQTSQFCLVQAKQSENPQERITADKLFDTFDADYSLEKHFRTYSELKGQLDGEIKKILLISTLDVDKEVREMITPVGPVQDKKSLKRPADDQIDHLLHIDPSKGCSLHYKFKPEMTLKRLSINDEHVEVGDFSEFLHLFILAIEQPTGRQLAEIIASEIRSELSFSKEAHQVVGSQVRDVISDCYSNKGASVSPAENGGRLFPSARGLTCHVLKIGYNMSLMQRLDSLGVVFDDKKLAKLAAKMENFEESDKKLVVIQSTSDETTLTAVKVMQILKSVADDYLWLSSASLIESRVVHFVGEYLKLPSPRIVVDCATTESVQVLLNVLDNFHKIILIGSTSLNVNRNCKVIQDSVTWDQLDLQCRQCLLNKTIQVNGAQVKLGDFFDEPFLKKMDPPTLHQLAESDIRIGSPLRQSSAYDQDYYIPRKFNYQLIKKDFRTIVEKDSSRKNEFCLTESEYRHLCHTNHSSNVYWLQPVDNCYRLMGVKGNFEQLLKYLEPNGSFQLDEETAIRETNKLVILADAAGAGKSTILTRIFHLKAKSTDAVWVIKIDLNEHSQVLDNSLVGDSIDILINSFLKTTSSLERAVLRNGQRVILMFDGFDEIEKRHQSVVVQLIKGLEKTKIRQIWVTTGPHLKEELEKEFELLSVSLHPFTTRQRVEFLRQFWTKMTPKCFSAHPNIRELMSAPSAQQKLELFAGRLVEKLLATIGDEEFVRVPLLCRLLAESYCDSVCSAAGTNEMTPLDDRLDIHTLYRRFLQARCRIYLMKMDPGGTDSVASMEIAAEFCLQRLALKLLFKDYADILWVENAAVKKLIQHLNVEAHLGDLGLTEDRDDGAPIFIHRTLAEYFAASYLADPFVYKVDALRSKFQRFLMGHVFVNDDYEVVQRFIDGFFCRLSNKFERRGGDWMEQMMAIAYGAVSSQLSGYNVYNFLLIINALLRASDLHNWNIVSFVYDLLVRHDLQMNDFNRQNVPELALRLDQHQRSSLHWVAKCGFNGILSNIFDILQMRPGLLDLNRILAPDLYQKTVLNYGAAHGSEGPIKEILPFIAPNRWGADYGTRNHPDCEGRTLLMYVALYQPQDHLWNMLRFEFEDEYPVEVEFLLRRDNLGKTLLTYAVQRQLHDCIRMILNHVAVELGPVSIGDVLLPDKEHKTILTYAAQYRHSKAFNKVLNIVDKFVDSINVGLFFLLDSDGKTLLDWTRDCLPPTDFERIHRLYVRAQP